MVRTFISIPAGIARLNFTKFILYSFIGSVIWGGALAYLGLKLGPAWLTLRDRIPGLDYLTIALIILAAVWWVYRHIRHKRTGKVPPGQS